MKRLIHLGLQKQLPLRILGPKPKISRPRKSVPRIAPSCPPHLDLPTQQSRRCRHAMIIRY